MAIHANGRQLRQSAFDSLSNTLGVRELSAAQNAAHRLMHVLGPDVFDSDRRSNPTALIAYGGGKDSSYMLAFTRYMQLYMYKVYQRVLELRVITNRHPGMPAAVIANIDRAYKALRLYRDPSVELLLVDGNLVRPFDINLTIPAALIRSSAMNILMTGHRCYGDGRPTFCNACNTDMLSAFAKGIAYRHGVDVVFTGDSRSEQGAYVRWIGRLGRQLSLPNSEKRGLAALLEVTGRVAGWYFSDIHGSDPLSMPALLEQAEETGAERNAGPLFFSIYEDAEYRASSHWAFLTEYLGFRFDELAFSFTESDCANPALMAHLRGLRAERVFGTSYSIGVSEYVTFATNLMRKKDFPDHLVTSMLGRYASLTGIRHMRRLVEDYALSAYGLTASQLNCMVFSPFASQGHHLERYLHSEVPDLAPFAGEIHALLSEEQNRKENRLRLVRRLKVVSGLGVRSLRHLYRSELTSVDLGAPASTSTPIGRVLADDPHKSTVISRDAVSGKTFLDHISGR